ncbi:hypothetical protein EYF80_066488 [Liparis tanakae]|uniref:Uncharacterized protein n=1 Tax=Liparis tanakae TaxID=230148 RepID=A0A4Z2E4X9_9TELE|nr:hypothetical protein EYF80_066488 [Liparis tanakae]
MTPPPVHLTSLSHLSPHLHVQAASSRRPVCVSLACSISLASGPASVAQSVAVSPRSARVVTGAPCRSSGGAIPNPTAPLCRSVPTLSLLPRRYDHYESFDSRSSSALASSRDLYRSGGGSYGYGDGREDDVLLSQRGGSGFGGGVGLGGTGGGFDSPSSSYGVAKMRPNMRESFNSGQERGSGGAGWPGAPRRGGSAGGRGAGGFGSRRPDPTPLGGGGGRGGQSHRGRSPGAGRGKLPSLLSNRMYPETGGFQQGPPRGPHDFPERHFGGGPQAGRQRGRKRPLNKQVKPPRDVQKKRKQTLTAADEPESKVNRTEADEADAAPGVCVLFLQRMCTLHPAHTLSYDWTTRGRCNHLPM